jgi:polysaccharide pyruvyl transferase WcaK-like protein
MIRRENDREDAGVQVGPSTSDHVHRVLLVNHWHDDNKGDSAITLASIDLVQERWPNAELTVASMLGDTDEKFDRAFRHVAAARPDVEIVPSLVASLGSSGEHPSLHSVLRWCGSLVLDCIGVVLGRPRRNLREALLSTDRVVLIGGSNLFDSGRVGFLGAFRLLQCALPAFAACRMGVQYLLLGHTLGPANTMPGRRILRRLVCGASIVVVREAVSEQFVRRKLGIDLKEALKVAPDVAFVTKPSDSDLVRSLASTPSPALNGQASPALQGPGVLVPRSHPYLGTAADDRLVAEMIRLGREALDTNTVGAVFVYAQCLGPTAIEDDRRIAQRVAAGDERFLLVMDDLSPGEVAQLFSLSAFVVAVRLHAVILALVVGTPVHAIEYFTSKTRGVLDSVGLYDHWSTFDEFDGMAALRSLVGLWAENNHEDLDSLAEQTAAKVRLVGSSLP